MAMYKTNRSEDIQDRDRYGQKEQKCNISNSGIYSDEWIFIDYIRR